MWGYWQMLDAARWYKRDLMMSRKNAGWLSSVPALPKQRRDQPACECP